MVLWSIVHVYDEPPGLVLVALPFVDPDSLNYRADGREGAELGDYFFKRPRELLLFERRLMPVLVR